MCIIFWVPTNFFHGQAEIVPFKIGSSLVHASVVNIDMKLSVTDLVADFDLVNGVLLFYLGHRNIQLNCNLLNTCQNDT